MATPAARKAGLATAAAPQLTTYRWSSSDEADRVPVEDPATGADVLEQHADELALLESRENGKPVQDARHNEQLLPRRNRYSLRRHEALRLRPRTRHRDAPGVQLHKDGALPVRTRDDPQLAGGRRHLRRDHWHRNDSDMSQASQTRQIPTHKRHGARLPRGAVLTIDFHPLQPARRARPERWGADCRPGRPGLALGPVCERADRDRAAGWLSRISHRGDRGSRQPSA